MYKINRYWHTCKKCRTKNGEYYLRANGPHYGLYCSKCDKWVKWVKQDEMLSLTGNKNIKKVYDKSNKEISVYKALNLEEPIPLDMCTNVDDLTQEELNRLDLPF